VAECSFLFSVIFFAKLQGQSAQFMKFTTYLSRIGSWLSRTFHPARERKMRYGFQRFFDWVIIVGKLSGLVLILLLIRNLSIEMRRDAYSIQPFHVPKPLEEAGYNGLVLAQKIMDEVAAIKADAGSIKNDSIQFNAAMKQDMDLSVMGVGFSTQTILFYVKQLLGKRDRTVSGELTSLGQTMTLALRFSDAEKIEVNNLSDSLALDQRLNDVMKAAAEKVLRWSDPYVLAVYYYHHNRMDEAMDCVRSILKQRPKEADWAYLAWGSILMRQQNPNGAIEKFERAIAIQPDRVPALVNLGWAYFQQNRFEEALPKFRKLLSLNADPQVRSMSYNGLAMSYIGLKRYAEAEQMFQRGIAEYPRDLYFYGNYADYKVRFKRDTAAALKLFQQGRANAPETAEGFLYQAGSLYYEHRVDSASKMMYKALEYDPNNIDALNQILQFEFRRKNIEKCLQAGRKLSTQLARFHTSSGDPKYRLQSTYNYLAMAHYTQLRYDSAIYYARNAIAVDTNVAYPYTSLAEAYAFIGQKDLFYHNVAKAVKKGFKYTQETLAEEPYVRFRNDPRFHAVSGYKPLKN
jgi:tetratricopeptide (TPR) repeat protein